MQLDALLTSLLQHCGDVPLLDLHVLFAASSPRMERQYAVLEDQWRNLLPVRFHSERRFRDDLLRILGLCTIESPALVRPRRGLQGRLSRIPPRPPAPPAVPWSNLMFLVDDCVFVRGFRLAEASRALRVNAAAVGFSLRLGRNTTHCYTLDRPQRLPAFTPQGGGVLAFDWREAECDFGYPLEVSSSLYRVETIACLLLGEDYVNPNTLEAALWTAALRFRHRTSRRELLCFEQSVAFCNAINRVQTTYETRSGESAAFSVSTLADRFDAGFRLDTDAFSAFVSEACHGEVPFKFAPFSAREEWRPRSS
jgi:hypothetical protein